MNERPFLLLCRLCGDPTSESEAVNIFQKSNSILKFIIRVRLQIEVISIGQHSNFVCPACFNHLENFHSFSKKCYLYQIQLAQVSHYPDTSVDDARDFVAEIEDQNEDVQSVLKRPRIEITADNCDNLILPGGTITAENCDNVIILEPTATENGDAVSHIKELVSDCDENLHRNSRDFSSRKVPLSRLKNFFRSRIRCTNNSSEDHSEKISSKSPSSDFDSACENTFEEDILCREGKGYFNKFKKRIPPRINVDDVQCPYCRWFIPKEEFAPDHLLLHVKNLDSEFHKLVMADDKKFSNESTLTPISSDFFCNECDEPFSKKLDFLEHRFIHENERIIACHICARAFGSRRRLRNHLCSIHLEKSFACEHCSFRAKNERDLRIHKVAVHTDARIQCPVCGKLIAAYSHNLNKHLETHNEAGTYKCDDCPAAYKTKPSLRKHRENKHYPIPTMCSLCGILCASQQKYSKHMSKCKKRNKKIDDVT